MGNSQFRFKQFAIEQDRCAMKVGTDGVLLGAWAEIDGAKRILDVGTGTALIALMCAQRNESAEIDAIEIDTAAAKQASENIQNSPFAARIELQHVALQEFSPSLDYDAIICNPPFFKAGTGSPVAERQQARHSVSLSIAELLEHSSRLTSGQGKLHLVLPLDREEELKACCAAHGWFIERVTVVYPNPNRPPKRMLISCSRKAVSTNREQLTLERGNRFDYTKEHIELTRNFYLKMK